MAAVSQGGRSFSTSKYVLMVIAVHPTSLPRAEAIRLLQQLEKLELIAADAPKLVRSRWAATGLTSLPAVVTRESMYRFESTLVQDVVYKMLPNAQRRDLHRCAVAVIAPIEARARNAVQNERWFTDRGHLTGLVVVGELLIHMHLVAAGNITPTC